MARFLITKQYHWEIEKNPVLCCRMGALISVLISTGFFVMNSRSYSGIVKYKWNLFLSAGTEEFFLSAGIDEVFIKRGN